MCPTLQTRAPLWIWQVPRLWNSNPQRQKYLEPRLNKGRRDLTGQANAPQSRKVFKQDLQPVRGSKVVLLTLYTILQEFCTEKPTKVQGPVAPQYSPSVRTTQEKRKRGNRSKSGCVASSPIQHFGVVKSGF